MLCQERFGLRGVSGFHTGLKQRFARFFLRFKSVGLKLPAAVALFPSILPGGFISATTRWLVTVTGQPAVLEFQFDNLDRTALLFGAVLARVSGPRRPGWVR